MKKIAILLTLFILLSELKAQWNTTNTPHIHFNTTGNVGIGTANPVFKLQVAGKVEIGDDHDPVSYGLLQLTRPPSPGDNKFYLSFIRNTAWGGGIGFVPNSNTLGIWQAGNTLGTPLLAFTTTQKIGIGISTPVEKLTIAGTDGNIHIGNTLFTGYNGIWLNGSINALDYNFLSKASDPNLYINRPAGAGIFFRQQNNTQMIIAHNGNVGIGTDAPLVPLTVVTNADDIANFKTTSSNNTRISVVNNTGQINLGIGSTNPHGYLWSSTDKFFIGNDDSNPTLFINGMHNGRVGIGTNKTADANYKLFVETGIRTRKVKVDVAVWSDYVFEKDYLLPSLKEVEQFIQCNQHLPDVPSANEVETEGLNLGDNQAILLKKIEEITLYLIQKDKEVELLNKRLATQEQLITDLQARISVIHPKN